MAEEPEQVLNSSTSPFAAGAKKCVETILSAISMLVTSMIAGIDRIVISEATSIAQRNTGIRASVMPGARILRMVAATLTEAHSAATSVKVIICAQMSARCPGA